MTKKNNILNTIIAFLLLLNLFNCKEEFEIETQDFESVLVVEATITNELKHQEIKLSRTYLLEESTQILENNANVEIIDNQQNTYTFSQNNDGIYVSDIEFQAEPNIAYKLLITTNNGKDYSSNEQLLTPISQIDNLYAELVNDEENGQGVQVFVDSYNSNNDAEYFRYEYEETYKIVAPFHSNLDANLINFDSQDLTYDIDLVPREQEERVCFNSAPNTSILQKTTSDLNQNLISRFPIRFIKSDDGIIRDRYSILVKQYVQNLEAYTYYKIISELGNNASILSQNQPGYNQGNIVSLENNNQKVLGFFEVSSIMSTRLYFNYEDFNISQPPFFYECDYLVLDYYDTSPPLIDGDGIERNILRTKLLYQNYKYVIGLYEIVNQECGDCTSFSSNIQPDFWED